MGKLIKKKTLKKKDFGNGHCTFKAEGFYITAHCKYALQAEAKMSGTDLGFLVYTPAVNVLRESMDWIMQTTIRLNTQFHEIWLLVT